MKGVHKIFSGVTVEVVSTWCEKIEELAQAGAAGQCEIKGSKLLTANGFWRVGRPCPARRRRRRAGLAKGVCRFLEGGSRCGQEHE